jgi:nucleoside-diphosphate-sugar epimerase
VTPVDDIRGNPLAADLDGILEVAGDALREFRGARLFVTGGTGFVGTWLMESLVWANRALALDMHAVVLTRNPDRFAASSPHLASDSAVSLLAGDIVDFDPPAGPFTHVVHAAAESSTQQNVTDPLRMVDTIVAGTRNVLDTSRAWGTPKVLFVSSGGVYGPQPSGMPGIPEEYLGGPDQLARGSAYPESKRLAELLCATYAAEYGLPVAIARCFAFVGPHLPLDAHFAVGNFIRDGLAGGPIQVRGDGSPIRSYLYAADLAAWLWTILAHGKPGRAYNVGSEGALSIADVARTVAQAFEPQLEVSIAGAASPNLGGGGNRYVPSTRRAQAELGLREAVDLPEAVRRTIAWNRAVAS